MKIICLGIILAFLLVVMSEAKPIHAESSGPVQILNVQVQPNIKVNDTFSLNMTILNNSAFPIYLTSGSCTPAFSVVFDAHAKQVYQNITCTTEAILQKVDPQSQVTISNANKPGIIYQAVQPGTATVNITLPYYAKNQTATDYSNIYYNASKSFSFTILNQFETPPQHAYGGGGPVVTITLDPLEQFKSGISAKDVTCKEGLQLVIKAEDGSPACVKYDTATKLITRGGWSKVIPSIENTNLNTLSENGCGQFYTAPGNQDNKKVPVLLMNSNSTGCTRLTFTIIYNYHDTPWPRIANFPPLGIVGNTNHVTHGDTFSVTPGKDFTNSFQITVMPQTVDLANYPIGSNFTVTYVIKPLPNATGFYDQSIPKLACERYPLAVGYAENQVNYSDFSYIDPLNPPCVSGPYELTAVEISGMNYKQVELGSHP